MPETGHSIIKVIGVGGGGGNAVNHMYEKGIEGVSFVVCNTDAQDLQRSPVPVKILLGAGRENEGLGAGAKPEVGRAAAESSAADIERMLDDGTKMVFVTAGMGGGTGTGAAPVIASLAKNMNILTVGIVTIPFAFERKKKVMKALEGVARMSESVDALLVINNDRLRDIYPDLDLPNAFAKADDVLTYAAKGIAEIVTKRGYINVDFADVNTVMRDGGMATMGTGEGKGEKRVLQAIEEAVKSPLLNKNDIRSCDRILFYFHCSKSNPVDMEESKQIDEFMAGLNEDIDVIWGVTFDEGIGEDEVRVTVIATGQNFDSIVPQEIRDKFKTGGSNADAAKGVDNNTVEWINDMYGEDSGLIRKPEVKRVTLKEILENAQLFDTMEREPAYKRMER